jgi:type III pantothenate kinase
MNKKSYLIAIDVGNTRMKWALYDWAPTGAVLIEHGAVVHEALDDLAGVWKRLPKPVRMIGCHVAGEAVKRRVEEQLQDVWGLGADWIIPKGEQCGVVNGYESPSRLGADRWAAIIGARARYPGEAAVIVLVGTAVTVEALSAKGLFIGGLILPGYGLMIDSLESGTAGLKVYAGEVRDFPTNTSDALMSGGAAAIAGAVDRMYALMTEYAGKPPRLLITGGAAPKLIPSLQIEHEHLETLIFDGLIKLAASSPKSNGV